MQRVIKLVSSGLAASMILASSVAMADTAADETIGNLTVEKRMYQHDGYGAQWAFDVGSDGLWFVNKAPLEGEDTYDAAFKVDNKAAANALVVGSSEVGMEGNVGFGTDTPDYKLHIESEGDTQNASPSLKATAYTNVEVAKAAFYLDRARGTKANPETLTDNNNLGKFVFRGYDGDQFDQVGATITVRAQTVWNSNNHGAKIQITQTAPGEELPAISLEIKDQHDVHIANGNLYVKGTKMSVPDYVFADDYKLMPLDKLKTYINKNSHLPGIASADEVGKAGVVNMSGLQMTLLEKVEELTLYTIQQEEKIKNLEDKQKDINGLQQRISSLESLLTNLALNADERKTEKVSLK